MRANSTVAQSTRSIDSFGRVSKRVASSSLKKTAVTPAPAVATIPASRQATVERFLAEKETKEESTEATVTVITVQPPTPTTTPKKAALLSTTAASSTKQRKRRAAEALDADSSSSTPSAQSQPASVKRVRRTAKAKTSVAELLARAAQKKENVPPSVDSDSDSTPTSTFNTEKTGNLIARLDLNFSSSFSSSPSPPRSSSSSPRPNSTAPTTPCESENECEGIKVDVPAATLALPLELLDLLRLQTAFSKTLAVHHAHHGANVPVDLRSFCPGVAQAWGKRRVTLEDVQRCLGVASLSTDASIANALFLSDYGRGKICIEMQPTATGPMSTLADQLNAAFEANLRARWVDAKAAAAKVDPKQFVGALPKAIVTKCASLLQSLALRTKGQRTLEELMNGIALQKQEKEAHEAMLKTPAMEAMQVDDKAESTPSGGAPMNLLDRIRFRQMQRAQLLASGDLAKPPTPEELERRAALQRAGDIAEVLSMLCTAASMRQSNRVPFGMTAIVSKIKDSLRTPIAREEAAACVRLLSKEVAPQWLQMVSMGGREIVIMMADKVPSKTEIHQRVQSLVQ
ncbi:hypothetical protein SCUCBS95973_008037 [Sporothrix curviconia]|uniref:DNA replication factor Cdt1 C-terminal domain-containing protein n=1 Tax=Sporothrix curviconia TaxID=1260050 RepID=A0ABP0CIU8_9PEZI